MKVLVALSGGPKSLVTAWLLKKQGMQVRGVHFDLSGKPELRDSILENEKRLGIPIQVLDVSNAVQELLAKEKRETLRTGVLFDARGAFHRKFLIPELVRLRKELVLDRISTGHGVTLQEDPVAGLSRIVRGTEFHFDSASLLIGLGKDEISRLLTPMGSIPESMLRKLTVELAPPEMTGRFEIHWDQIERDLTDLDPEALRQILSVYGSGGGILGAAPYGNLQIGGVFLDVQDPSRRYRIVDLNPPAAKALAEIEEQVVLTEFEFEGGNWFSREDLKMRSLTLGLLSSKNPKPIGIRLIQYEGFRLKGVLETPLRGTAANILRGDIVLFTSGDEVVGGGRVLKVR